MRRMHRNSRTGLYRSRNGVILGVCRGIAEYFDFNKNELNVILKNKVKRYYARSPVIQRPIDIAKRIIGR